MDEMAESLVSNSLLALNTSTGRCYMGQRWLYSRFELPYLQYNELQLRHIIWVNPVLGRLPHEVLLPTSGGAVPFYRFSPGADDIVQLRQLDDKRIVIATKERLRF